ncbi:MAG: hypothetical protein AB7O96_05645 [Pseudobdellovibrionaceae bacterium]
MNHMFFLVSIFSTLISSTTFAAGGLKNWEGRYELVAGSSNCDQILTAKHIIAQDLKKRPYEIIYMSTNRHAFSFTVSSLSVDKGPKPSCKYARLFGCIDISNTISVPNGFAEVVTNNKGKLLNQIIVTLKQTDEGKSLQASSQSAFYGSSMSCQYIEMK